MDRVVTHKWLTTVYADLLALAGIGLLDDEAGVAYILDQVAALYEARPALSPAYANDLALWFALQPIHAALLASGMKITVDGDTFDLSATLTGIDRLISTLRGRIGWIIEPVVEEETGIGKVVTVFSPWTASGLDPEGWSW